MSYDGVHYTNYLGGVELTRDRRGRVRFHVDGFRVEATKSGVTMYSRKSLGPCRFGCCKRRIEELSCSIPYRYWRNTRFLRTLANAVELAKA